VIIVFDLCAKDSFNNLHSWMSEVEKYAGPEVQVMVLANKSDLPEEDLEVTDEEIKRFEQEAGRKVVKCSAKTGEKVDDSFLELTKALIAIR